MVVAAKAQSGCFLPEPAVEKGFLFRRGIGKSCDPEARPRSCSQDELGLANGTSSRVEDLDPFAGLSEIHHPRERAWGDTFPVDGQDFVLDAQAGEKGRRIGVDR